MKAGIKTSGLQVARATTQSMILAERERESERIQS
jgi:hypothetical protein